ncbi:MAG: PKD domain-containing protein [Sphingobacteriales bacterium]|nr:MAG: PKD domain-containing protein [Sphingobacteriales bacterium]
MKKFLLLTIQAALVITTGTLSAHEGHVSAGSSLQFVPNLGQWAHPFLYKGISPNADIYLEKSGLKILVGHPQNNELFKAFKDGKHEESPLFSFHAYKINWVNGNPDAQTVPGSARPDKVNYFLGNDPQRWKSDVSSYGTITYKEVYPGTDFYFYTEGSGLKYDIILRPNADPAKVALEYEGLNGMRVEKGNLVLMTSVGEIVEQKPYAYQYKDGAKVEVKCTYRLEGNVLKFDLKSYDKNSELVIDPQIVFASLTGSVADNWGFTATYDAQGNLYAGGIVRGAGYPLSVGALQGTYGGGNTNGSFGIDCDIAVSKFNAIGNTLLYSTYIGGSGNEMPHSLVVDANNNLVIAGKSMSANYPTLGTSYSPAHNGGFDIILTKLNAAGTALIGSTYVGGTGDDGVNINAAFFSQTSLKHNYGDDARSEVIVDKSGNIYLAGNTRSTDFPVTATALKSNIGGTQDGVYLKFNANLSTMLYGTYIGGSAADGAYSIALDTSETKVYITGGTESSDFHTSSLSGAYQSAKPGAIDGFIMRFNNTNNTLIRSTYIGTAAYDQIYGVQIDNKNAVYVMGQTQGNFPVFPAGVYQNPNSRQFVMKLDSSLATGIFSTVYGSGAVPNVNISPVAFLVDTCENIYISGWGGLTTAGPPTTVIGMPITTTALQPGTDGADFYFIVLKKELQSLLYGSYFGAAGIEEHVDGGTSRFDPNGVVYQAICASCGPTSSFPATPGAVATTENSGNCNLGVVKIAFNLGSVSTNAQATPSATGCAPFTVNFLDNSTNATAWSWNFGDNTTSNQQTPSHTYTTPGVYTVRLIGSNPDACRVVDTSYVTITVTDDAINPAFTTTILDSCELLRVVFNNTSTGIGGGPATGAGFFWDFGNGNTFNGANPPAQVYTTPGTFQVKLVMTMAGACNTPDSVVQTLTFDPLYVSAPELQVLEACVGATVNFPTGGINVTTYQWDLGDGNNSNAAGISHTYTEPGTYNIVLIVGNPASCNKFDTVSTSVTVRPAPKAAFVYSPAIAETNVPFTFTNQSEGATAYKWDFGDTRTSTEEHPVHEYLKSGLYEVCLTATNQYNCSDKICKTLEAVVYPLADVPSGFSPNGDGNNDVFRVRGYGIATMNLKVFNRWGEQIFETSDQDVGWDGTYKGKLQEMDAYGYVLVVEFVDGTSTKKQGNVTLLK